MADDYRQRLTEALESVQIRLNPNATTIETVKAGHAIYLDRNEVMPLVGAVLVARDQELDALRREVRRWRRRAGEAEGVVTRMRELLQEAAQLCTSCDRWHKDECWRLCPEDGARAERISRDRSAFAAVAWRMSAGTCSNLVCATPTTTTHAYGPPTRPISPWKQDRLDPCCS
jgi:hypothetical protein